MIHKAFLKGTVFRPWDNYSSSIYISICFKNVSDFHKEFTHIKMYNGSAESGGVIIIQTETQYLLENIKTNVFGFIYFKNQI